MYVFYILHIPGGWSATVLIYSTDVSLLFSKIPEHIDAFAQYWYEFKVPSRQKSGSCFRNHLRLAVSSSSLFWKRQHRNTASATQTNGSLMRQGEDYGDDRPKVPTEKTATIRLSGVCCVGLHFRTYGAHIAADGLCRCFGHASLQRHVTSARYAHMHQFNEEDSVCIL